MQLGVDLFYNMLSIRKKGILDVIVGLSIALFAVFGMCFGGSCIAVFLLKNNENIRFLFYLPLILSGAVMILQGIERVITGICRVSFTVERED